MNLRLSLGVKMSVNGCLKCPVEGYSGRRWINGCASPSVCFILLFFLKCLLTIQIMSHFSMLPTFLGMKSLHKHCWGQKNIHCNSRSQMLLPHESALAEESTRFYRLAREEESSQGICIISFTVLQHFWCWPVLRFDFLAALHYLLNPNWLEHKC